MSSDNSEPGIERVSDDPIESLDHGWEKVRLRHLVDINPNSVNNSFSEEDEIEYVEISSVNDKGDINNCDEYLLKNAPDRAQRTVNSGDVIVSTVRTYLKAISLIENPSSNLVVSSGFAVLRPGNRIKPEFLWRVLQSTPFVDWIVANSEGVSYPAISTERLADIVIPVPPYRTQEHICEYLESRLSDIDELNQRIRDLRQLLEDRIYSVTKEYTLGGVEDADTEPSQVGWVEEIPQEWESVRTRFLARLESGHTPSKSNDEYWVDCDIPWVTTSDIEEFRSGRKVYLQETEYKINELGLKNSGARLLPEGTVFLSRTASVGFSGIMGKEMATSQDFANWICGDELVPEYLLYVFRSMDQEFDRLTQGSTHQTIYMPDIRSFKTPLPPVEEQRRIVEEIEEEREKVWKLIDRLEEVQSLLNQKRQALITSASTGQIDVITG